MAGERFSREEPVRTGRAKRTKKLIEDASTPKEGAKRRLFGRVAREVVRNKQEVKARAQQETAAKSSAKREAGERALAEKNSSLAELRVAQENEHASPAVRAFAEKRITELQSEIAALASDAVELPSDEAAPEKLHGIEREAAYQSIEGTMERLVAKEEQFEDLLRFSREHGHWQNYELADYGAFIDRTYLTPGTTEKIILESFVDDPKGLPPDLRRVAAIAVDKLVETQLDTLVSDSGFTGNLAVDFRNHQKAQLADSVERNKLIHQYLAGEHRPGVLPLSSPDAAMIAVREAVFAKGTLDVNDARVGLATFVARTPDGRRLQSLPDDARRALIATEKNPHNFEAQRLLETSRLDFADNRKGLRDVERDFAKCEEAIAKLTATTHELEGQTFNVDEKLVPAYEGNIGLAMADVRWPLQENMRRAKETIMRMHSAEQQKLALTKATILQTETLPPDEQVAKWSTLVWELRRKKQEYQDFAHGPEVGVTQLHIELAERQKELREIKQQITTKHISHNVVNDFHVWTNNNDAKLKSLRVAEATINYSTYGRDLVNRRKIDQEIAELDQSLQQKYARIEGELKARDSALGADAKRRFTEAAQPLVAENEAVMAQLDAAIAELEQGVVGAKEEIRSKVTELAEKFRAVAAEHKKTAEDLEEPLRHAKEALATAEKAWFGKEKKVAAAADVVRTLTEEKNRAESAKAAAQNQVNTLTKGDQSVLRLLDATNYPL